jgi:dienelactone hydrolase
MHARTLLGFIVAVGCAAGISSAQDIAFRKHVVNANAQFTAAMAVDVNKDGKLDIVCGDSWYEGPDFKKKHFIRDVEVIQGRPDGYAHLPLDVNGDGWPDVVTVNWRSRSIKWIENPGPPFGPWKTHLVAEPGAMETGRLVDMEGNGKPAVLPNGATFAAWWSLDKKPDGSLDWQRHDLPKELAGHGIGFGDINGDGRGDVVGRFGWAEAPVDRRNGRWIWHPDFDLDAASVPILVVDVNGDGLNDIVYSRAHHCGVYWLEQTRKDGKIGWVKHTIDSSWCGGHAPLWADLDGDGIPELVVGKRYLAHEGRDPGEYDPLVGYRYQFNKATKTWNRSTITYNDRVAFGLDPKAVDLNGDGKLDLLVADRCGLYWLENLGPTTEKTTGDPTAVPTYTDHTNLLMVKDPDGKERPVKTPFDWGQRREHVLATVEKVLGPLPGPAERLPIEPWKPKPGSDGQTVPWDRIHVPENRVGKRPAVICLIDQFSKPMGGPGEVIDESRISAELTNRGYVCLEALNPSDQGMKSVGTIIHWLDLLDSMSIVDINRIAVMGHGSGGKSAMLAAAFDQRVSAVVSSCGFAPLKSADGKTSAEVNELVAALAPRPTYLIAPTKDTFDVEKAKAAIASARSVFAFKQAERSLVAVYPNVGREFPEAERMKAYEWLDKILKP